MLNSWFFKSSYSFKSSIRVPFGPDFSNDASILSLIALFKIDFRSSSCLATLLEINAKSTTKHKMVFIFQSVHLRFQKNLDLNLIYFTRTIAQICQSLSESLKFLFFSIILLGK